MPRIIVFFERTWNWIRQNPYLTFAIALISIGILTIIIYLIMLSENYRLGNSDINIGETGAVGDFVGGFVGTIFSLAGFIVVYLTFLDQKEANQKENIQTRVTSFIEIHMENVKDIEYKNPYNNV